MEEYIFNPIPINEHANFNIQDRHLVFPYGESVLGGVEFTIPETTPNLFVTNFADGWEFLPTVADFPAQIDNPIAVYVLINGGNTYTSFYDEQVGKIGLTFDDGSEFFEEIIAGYNFRDWNLENPTFAIATLDPASNTIEVTPPGSEACNGCTGPVAVDMMEIQIPQEYTDKKLENITILDTSLETTQTNNPAIAIYGITVTSRPSPIIFLPGMTACWNGQAILSGEPAEEWNLLPIAYTNFYGDLFASFTAAGLVQDQDWHLFCYDWRRPIADNAAKLKDFIESVAPGETVNLIGHSMGGLISRAYVQLYPDNAAENVITVGSPHQGAVRVYPAWEGGELWEYSPFIRSLMELVIWINQEPGEIDMDAIRRVIPSMQDLLPTFDFLQQADSQQIKDINTHIHQNELFNSLNPMPETIKPLFSTIHGNGESTLEKIQVSLINSPHANWTHYAQGLWEDGEPTGDCLPEECDTVQEKHMAGMIKTDQGDGTVLTRSATIDGVADFEINADHGSLLKQDDVLQNIFTTLNITQPPSVTPFHAIKSIVAFVLRSPAEMTVTDSLGNQAGYDPGTDPIPGAFYDPNAKILLIPDPELGNFQVDIAGTGEGDYKLLAMRTPENEPSQFYEISLPTFNGDEQTLTFNFEQADSPLIDQNGELHLESAKTKIQHWLTEISTSELKFYQQKLIGFWLNRALKLVEQAQDYVNAGQALKAGRQIESAVFPVYKARRLLNFWQESELDQSQSIVIDLQFAFEANDQCSCHEQSLQQRLNSKQKRLEQIDQKYQLIANRNQPIAPQIATAFQEAGELLAAAKQALDENELPKAAFLEMRLGFVLLELNPWQRL